MCRTFLILAMLAGCAEPLTSDQAELRNIKFNNRLPKSSPSQFVKAFEDFCVEAASPSARETKLRKVGYIPLKPKHSEHPHVFLVDDRRPAIMIGERLCSTRALSRTGQTERLRSYVKTRFPTGRLLRTGSAGPDVEQLWQVNGPDPTLIATERGNNLDGRTSYAVTIFRLRR